MGYVNALRVALFDKIEIPTLFNIRIGKLPYPDIRIYDTKKSYEAYTP